MRARNYQLIVYLRRPGTTADVRRKDLDQTIATRQLDAARDAGRDLFTRAGYEVLGMSNGPENRIAIRIRQSKVAA